MAHKAQAKQCLIGFEIDARTCKNLNENLSILEHQIKKILEDKGYSVLDFNANNLTEDRLTIYITDKVSTSDCYGGRSNRIVNSGQLHATFQFLPKNNDDDMGHSTVSSSALLGNSNRAWRRFANLVLNHLDNSFFTCK